MAPGPEKRTLTIPFPGLFAQDRRSMAVEHQRRIPRRNPGIAAAASATEEEEEEEEEREEEEEEEREE